MQGHNTASSEVFKDTSEDVGLLPQGLTGASQLSEVALGSFELGVERSEAAAESVGLASGSSELAEERSEVALQPPSHEALVAKPAALAITACSPLKVGCDETADSILAALEASDCVGVMVVKFKDTLGRDSAQVFGSQTLQSEQATQDTLDGSYLLLHAAKPVAGACGNPAKEDVCVLHLKSWAQGMASDDVVATRLVSILTASQPLKVGSCPCMLGCG
jgi:hypothetical protein